MTNKTASYSVRVPKEVKKLMARELTRKCFEGIAEQIERGEIELSDRGVVIPEDEDGVWVREMAHDLNIDKEVFKKKVEQGMR